MEQPIQPTQPQAQPPEQTQGSTSSLDPQAVNLAKAIRQVESGGNATAQGKSGEYGAYQFTEPTWQAEAPAAGINVPLQQSTLQQQNAVAYNAIEKKKQEGMNVSQIASLWNSGDPNAFQNPNMKGTNSSGADYDVPAYTKKVEDAYTALKNGQNPQVEPQTTSGMSTLEKILFGVGGLGLGIAGVLGAPETGGASLADEPEAAAMEAEAVGDTGGGILSSIYNGAKSVLTNPVVDALGGAETAKNILTGGSQSSQTSPPPQSTPTTPDVSEEGNQNALSSSNAISQAVQDSANQTQAGSKLMQTQAGIQGAQTIGQNGFTPDTEDGRQNWAQSIIEADNRSGELDDVENQLLDAEGSTGSISEVAGKAKEIVRNTLPETEWEEAYRTIDEDAKTYQTTLGKGGLTVPLGSGGIGKIRSNGYKAYDRNSSTAKNGARKAMGSAANHHMLEKTKHKELIGGLHKEKQKLIYAKKVMTHLNGKKATPKKGILPNVLKRYGEYLGIALGDKIGGPLGAVIGSMVGTQLIKSVDKKFGKDEFSTPVIKKALELLHQKNPSVYGMVKKELKKYEIEVEKEQRMEQKRQNYKEKKKGILDTVSEKKSEYEPYSPVLPTISAGRAPKKKETLPIIR